MENLLSENDIALLLSQVLSGRFDKTKVPQFHVVFRDWDLRENRDFGKTIFCGSAAREPKCALATLLRRGARCALPERNLVPARGAPRFRKTRAPPQNSKERKNGTPENTAQYSKERKNGTPENRLAV